MRKMRLSCRFSEMLLKRIDTNTLQQLSKAGAWVVAGCEKWH
jgi:hypothetical protein